MFWLILGYFGFCFFFDFIKWFMVICIECIFLDILYLVVFLFNRLMVVGVGVIVYYV